MGLQLKWIGSYRPTMDILEKDDQFGTQAIVQSHLSGIVPFGCPLGLLTSLHVQVVL
jgi:hypothetical protein